MRAPTEIRYQQETLELILRVSWALDVFVADAENIGQGSQYGSMSTVASSVFRFTTSKGFTPLQAHGHLSEWNDDHLRSNLNVPPLFYQCCEVRLYITRQQSDYLLRGTTAWLSP